MTDSLPAPPRGTQPDLVMVGPAVLRVWGSAGLRACGAAPAVHAGGADDAATERRREATRSGTLCSSGVEHGGVRGTGTCGGADPEMSLI